LRFFCIASITNSPVVFIHSAIASLAAQSIDTPVTRAYASNCRYATSERTTVRLADINCSFKIGGIVL
jgi:hypothetical protein